MKQIKRARKVNHLNASLPEKFLLLSMKIIKGEYFYREGAEYLLYANEIQGVDEQRNEIVDEEKILPYDNSRAWKIIFIELK